MKTTNWECCWTDRLVLTKLAKQSSLRDRGSGNTNLHTCRDVLLAQRRAASPHRLLSFAGFRFHSLGCGEFPVSVWLGARGTRMQFASFPDRSTTSSTRHGQYLFRGEFFGLHHHIMQLSHPRKCSILLILSTFSQAAGFILGARVGSCQL